MKNKTECKCGFLYKLAKDPDVQFEHHTDLDTFTLALGETVSVLLAFCPFCGGRKITVESKGRRCECLSVSKWASDPSTPVEYDAEVNEYYLASKSGEKIYFRYCPVCGGSLPPSKRENFFTIPSEEEIFQIKDKLKSASSINEVIEILGQPDERDGIILSDPQKKKIYGMQDVKQTIKYMSVAQTLIVFIQEFQDGKIGIFFTGKPKQA